MKIKNLESDRKQRIETLRETIRGCEREIRRLEDNFVIKAGSYFNKTKMDADNYYVKAYDMHELPEIINGLS